MASLQASTASQAQKRWARHCLPGLPAHPCMCTASVWLGPDAVSPFQHCTTRLCQRCTAHQRSTRCWPCSTQPVWVAWRLVQMRGCRQQQQHVCMPERRPLPGLQRPWGWCQQEAAAAAGQSCLTASAACTAAFRHSCRPGSWTRCEAAGSRWQPLCQPRVQRGRQRGRWRHRQARLTIRSTVCPEASLCDSNSMGRRCRPTWCLTAASTQSACGEPIVAKQLHAAADGLTTGAGRAASAPSESPRAAPTDSQQPEGEHALLESSKSGQVGGLRGSCCFGEGCQR